jgi:hypothetical protein
MTEKTIAKFIKKLNQNINQETIFIQPISDNIDFAIAWDNFPKITDSIIGNEYPYSFYFIKNEGNYIGAVLDMGSDLHWYINGKSRGNGYLTKALKEVVLPHLFLKKSKQRITISKTAIGPKNAKASERLALEIGFKMIKETPEGKVEYLLLRRNFKTKFSNPKIKSQMSLERLKLLKKRINYASKILWLIKNEFEMKFYEDAGLAKDVVKIKKYTWKLEDIWWKNKNNN